ncbi:zinc finger protein 271-like [Centruroides vittatus]|uniref:zinc finger protein 271-like n=1 Tax=Centruroides vittatus TaxID=120091 RepID=UPI00350F4E89
MIIRSINKNDLLEEDGVVYRIEYTCNNPSFYIGERKRRLKIRLSEKLGCCKGKKQRKTRSKGTFCYRYAKQQCEFEYGNANSGMLDENKKFECSQCKKRFHDKWDLDRHMKVHTGEKPYECTICGKKFSQSGNLVVHKKRHSEEKPFKCYYKDCTHSAKMKHDLIKHVNRTHLKKRPEKLHTCPKCDKNFECLSALKIHLISHETIRSISCGICKKMFKYKYQLKKHVQKVHPQEETEHFSKKSIQHAEQVPIESFQTPSTSAQATKLIEEVASSEMIFTPRKAEEFLQHFNIDTEIMQMETSSQTETFSQMESFSQMEIPSQIEIEEHKFECLFCKERFSDELSRKEHERNAHNFCYF